MKNLTILKLNNFDTTFWKSKLGFNQEFNLLDYSDQNLLGPAFNSSIVVLDFYFSATSLDEEHEITLNVMSQLVYCKHKIDLFVLSPSYAGETILHIGKKYLDVYCHNFSGDILEQLCNQLANINFKKAS